MVDTRKTHRETHIYHTHIYTSTKAGVERRKHRVLVWYNINFSFAEISSLHYQTYSYTHKVPAVRLHFFSTKAIS